VRRSALLAVGGFDEQFVGSAINEESDFARRLLAGGYRIVTEPGVNVLHLRAPAGGCRVPGNLSHPEWAKTVGHWIFAYRHLRGGEFVQEVRRSLRGGPFRRENLVRPWRWPWAWGHFFRAMGEGRRRARAGVVSPFKGT
jgi:GT2 family glycosyltransferase